MSKLFLFFIVFSILSAVAYSQNNIGIGTTTPAEKLDVSGKTKTTDLQVTNGAATGLVLTSDALGNATWQAPATPVETDPQVGLLNNYYVPRWNTGSGNLINSLIQDNGTSISVGSTAPSVIYQFFAYRQQLTINGDGQSTLLGYRTRDSQNDGISYAQNSANDATRGYNFWGDVYTFGVGGWNYNDYSRCGGTFGAEVTGAYWGSLGYRSSGLLNYGVYGNSAYTSGGGYLPSTDASGIGGGFFGVIGSMSKGSVIGQLNEGELFAVYNKGDVYTSGKSIELVTTNEKVIPSYAVTSSELKIYSSGKIQMQNGTATVTFDENFSNLLGNNPIVTASAMGECNGVYISTVNKNGFVIKEFNKGNSTAEISWIAVGNRVDAEQATIPSMLTKIEFNRNISKALFADGDKKHSGIGMWWNGKELEFGDMPASLNLTREQKTKMLEAEKQVMESLRNEPK